jgi:glycosyltransferase involved in cell wall biosynthesis
LAVRVLHIIGAMDLGGVEIWLMHLLRNIEHGHLQFDFCTFGPKPGRLAGEVGSLGGRIVPCPRGKNPWSFSRRFRKILRAGNYDAVHSHVNLFSGVVLRWAQAEGIPMRIAHSHITQDDKPSTLARRYYRRRMESWIRRYATHGLAVSKPAAANLYGKNWESDGRFRVVPCGIDLEPFQEPVARDEIRRKFGIPLKSLVVGHVGRFDPQKNHRFLIEVAATVSISRPDTNFLLIGDGPLRPEMEARVRQMGLSNMVHFAGIRTDVPRLMLGAMDLFVFPSLYEGLGICLLEAQAAGLRCLVSDTVPDEVVRVPESVEFLPLSAGTDHWAKQVIGRLDARQPELTPLLKDVTRRQFSMQQSVGALTDLYLSARKPFAPNIPHQHA